MTTQAERLPETAPADGVKAKQSLGSRLVERVSGGLISVVLVLVALFWLVPTIGLLISSLRTRRTSPRPAGGRSSPNRPR